MQPILRIHLRRLFVDRQRLNRTTAGAHSCSWVGTLLIVSCIPCGPLLAQEPSGLMLDVAATQPHEMTGMASGGMTGMESHDEAHAMPGLLGPAMTRESSGTSWQPESTPMPSPMIHIM